MRANCANSSTSALSDSTSPTIVVVHSSTSARVGSGAPPKWRRMRSAESWIGVSGFLISCASRRATSRQAATRCVRTSGVTSSNTRTVPSCAPASPCSAVTAAARWISRPSRGERNLLRGRFADAGRRPSGRARRAAAGRRGRGPRSTGEPTIPRSSSSRRAAAELIVLTRPVGANRHHAGRDALEDRLDVAAPLVELGVLALHLDPRSFEAPLAGRQLAGHRVEGLDQRAELVARLGSMR